MRFGGYIRYFSTYWRGSIRRQLVLGFALASLGLMLAFGVLIFQQQKNAMYRLSEARATEMAHTLSISGTSWALAHDLVGLQEVVQGVEKTPDLQRAYFLDVHGEVLASTNPDEVGFFVIDPVSRDMLASTAMDSFVLVSNGSSIVVAHPVMAEGKLISWVRVEMGRNTINQSLKELTHAWFLFLLIAVLTVSLVALSLARRLTRGLDHLMLVAEEVEHGQEERRSDTGRTDEIGVLARHLDRMLDAVEQQKRLVSDSEARYRFLADNISDVIWIANIEKDRWEYMSPSVKKMLGFTVEEIVAQPMSQALTSDSYANIKKLIEERSQLYLSGHDGSHVYTDEVEQRCSNGLSLWTEVTMHFGRNAKGELVVFGVTRDISERKKAEEQIRNLAFFDTLTHLPNRRMLQDRFNLVVSACKRNNRYAAMMFIDLDNFKPLNDEHGHDAGDILLIEVARRLRECVREVDTVARFGGDEFVVMLGELDTDKNKSAAQAATVAEKIRRILGKQYQLTLAPRNGSKPEVVHHHCSASIGVVLFKNNGVKQDDLLRLADAAMYQAKSAGRNQVHFAET